MTTPSTSPIPSKLPQDLLFNAEKLDEVVNGTGQTYRDRLGRDRLTAQGATDSMRAINPRGAWASGVVYAARDVVTSGGSWWIALDGHTSGGSFAADQVAHWRPYQLLTGDVTIVVANGVADRAQLAAAEAVGRPIAIIGIAKCESALTITSPLVDSFKQMFTTDSLHQIANGLINRPEWYGPSGPDAGVIRYAVNTTQKAIIPLRTGFSYRSGYDSGTAAMFDNRGGTPGYDYMIKPNIWIIGEQLPDYVGPYGAETGFTNGAVIRGRFFVSSEAENFFIDNVGIDASATVTAALYGGADADAMCVIQVNKATPYFGKFARMGRVRTLGPGGSTLAHGILAEALEMFDFEYLESRRHYHGVVIKSKNVTGRVARGLETSGESVIIKSDDYAPMANVKIDEVDARSLDSVVDTTAGLVIEATTADGGNVQVGMVHSGKKANGIIARTFNGKVLSDVTIGSHISEDCPIGVFLSGDVRGFKQLSGSIKNATVGVEIDGNCTDASNLILNTRIKNVTDGFRVRGRITADGIDFDTVTGYALNYQTVGARVRLGRRTLTSVANFWPLSFGLVSPWVNEGNAANPTFDVTLEDWRVRLSGYIKGGTSATFVSGFSTQVRPTKNTARSTFGRNGATSVIQEVMVLPSGDLQLPAYAQAPTYISLEGVSWDIPF